MPRKPNIDNDRYNDPFPTILRQLMDERGTRQEDLISVLGVKNRQSVTGYRDGSTLPTIDKLVSLAKYFDVSTDYLLGRTGAKTDDPVEQIVFDYTGLSLEAIRRLHQIKDYSPLIEAYSYILSDHAFLDSVASYCALFALKGLSKSRFRAIPLKNSASILMYPDIQYAKAIKRLETLRQSFESKFNSDSQFIEKTIKSFVAGQIDMYKVRRDAAYREYLDYLADDPEEDECDDEFDWGEYYRDRAEDESDFDEEYAEFEQVGKYEALDEVLDLIKQRRESSK